MKFIYPTSRQFAFILISGVWFAPISVFAYFAAPVAQTDAPTFVNEKSAQLNGKVNSNEMPDTTQWFEWGVAGRAETVYETPRRGIQTGNKLGNTNTTIVGLAPNMQYFYRQVAENGRGKDVGQTTYFTTKPLLTPVLPLLVAQTSAPESVTETSANLKGYVSPHGNTEAKWWFEWGATSKLENKTPSRGTGANSESVQISIDGLIPGTLYFFRIVVENELGQVSGATRVFTTKGTPPQVTSEAPRNQSVQTPSAGDNVTRTVTTSGKQKNSGNQGDSGGSGSSWLPGVSTTNRPGDIFGAIFGRKQSPADAPNSVATSAVSQTGAVGASSSGGSVWNTLSGKKSVNVSIEKVGPKSVPAHTAIEYRVTYTYNLSSSATGAKLKIILPENVIYIGDNTENELLLEESAGPERTYILPIGQLERGSTRTISILGMTTGAANGAFPDARARLEYTTTENTIQVVSSTGPESGGNTPKKTVSDSSVSFLPSSILGWVLYTLLVVGFIVSIRKAKAYYKRRKEEIEQEEVNLAKRRALLDSQKDSPVVV